jgi:hypothetical protein
MLWGRWDEDRGGISLIMRRIDFMGRLVFGEFVSVKLEQVPLYIGWRSVGLELHNVIVVGAIGGGVVMCCGRVKASQAEIVNIVAVQASLSGKCVSTGAKRGGHYGL